MTFLEKLNERYAAKAMNGQCVAEDKIDRILEAIRLAPTSSGLQPFEVFVITSGDLKTKIRAIAWDQSPVTDCSHLLVFAAWDTYTEERINRVFDLTNEIRGVTLGGYEKYRELLLKTYPRREAEENFHHCAKQTYIAFMAAIAQAAYEGVDATPMEGFDARELDKILDLSSKGLRSTLMLPLGYRDVENDWLVNLPKSRKPLDEIVTVLPD